MDYVEDYTSKLLAAVSRLQAESHPALHAMACQGNEQPRGCKSRQRRAVFTSISEQTSLSPEPL